MIKKDHKGLNLSKYFELIKPKYVYIKIIPDKSIRNYNTTNIIKAIAYTYKSLLKRIKIEQKKIFFETSFKISYLIDITKNDVSFYFLVPEVFQTILIEKIREVWNKATIIKDVEFKSLNNKAEIYQLYYKKEDALSIKVDKASNEPLNQILSVAEILKEDDRVTIIYNFMPREQGGWIRKYTTTMNKLKEHKLVDKPDNTLEYKIKVTVGFIATLMDTVLEVVSDFLGNDSLQKLNLYSAILGVLEEQRDLTAATKRKKESTIINTQIAVVSGSENDVRKVNNALAVCQSYRSLDSDNELVCKRYNRPIIIENDSLGTEVSITSTDECQNFIQVPGRTLLKEFNIQHVKINEIKLPKELEHGYIELGSIRHKGTIKSAFIEDDYNIGSLPLEINGAQGSGKSTFIANMYRFANSRKEGGVLIDFIKNNELTEEVLNYLPKDDVLILDYSDERTIQGFAFNEFSVNGLNSFQKVKMANFQAQQVLELINAINMEQPLQARMRKYLIAAATVVFYTGETSLKEVCECLEDHVTRTKYINLAKGEVYLSDKIKYLEELHEWSKATKIDYQEKIIGTRESRIDGLLDRISLLKEDFSLEFMFNKGGMDYINFSNELEKGKVIIIKKLQDEFSYHAKNVITTFILSKVWLATEIRGKINAKPKRTYITVDEINQTPTAMNMLAKKTILTQTRKFGCKFVFSSQGLNQLGELSNTLEEAGATFMLLKGTKEEDFNRFKNKWDGFEYEDLKDMDQYSSLNLVYYNKGYSSFITKLPKPIV